MRFFAIGVPVDRGTARKGAESDVEGRLERIEAINRRVIRRIFIPRLRAATEIGKS
jgi:hypothetical protein